jgi:hypothetical protein
MSTEHQWQTGVGQSNGQVTFATRRHLAAASITGLYKNRGLLENGGSWTKNVYRTPIANRGRPIERSSYFRHAAPPSGSFRFRSVQNRGILENGGSWTKNVYRAPIANRGRPIEWSNYFT